MPTRTWEGISTSRSMRWMAFTGTIPKITLATAAQDGNDEITLSFLETAANCSKNCRALAKVMKREDSNEKHGVVDNSISHQGLRLPSA